MTRRRVISSVVRAMFQLTPRTLAKWLGSVTTWQGGSAPAARFSEVSSRLAETLGQIMLLLNVGCRADKHSDRFLEGTVQQFIHVGKAASENMMRYVTANS